MANITTENINTLAQLAASISDGDYIYIYKASSHSFARIEKSMFLQAIGGASSSQTITNVDIIQEKFDALIDALANYAFIDGKSDSMKIGELDWESQSGGDEPTPTPTPAITSPTNNSTVSVGTNTGSGVSKTIAIKGSNLTKQLTVSVSGTGFSVEPSFIPAASANNGTHITVTYNGTDASATGSVVIRSSEDSVTVNLTASYEEEVVATPTLSSPTDTSINVGTISASGMSVSIQKTVRGSNLTDDGLTVAVTGEGFSVAPTTITKTEAETGQTITITYSNSETQSSLLTATGSLQISGGGITTKTIPLTASKQAEGVTPTPTGYVTDGLVLHLDGLNQGGVNGKWIDQTANAREFILKSGATKTSDGVLFDSLDEYGAIDGEDPVWKAINPVDNATDASEWTYNNFTIEVCFTPANNFTNEARVLFGNAQEGGLAAFYTYSNGAGFSFGCVSKYKASETTYKNFNYTKRNISDAENTALNSGALTTLSMSKDRHVLNGVTNTSELKTVRAGISAEGALTVGGITLPSEWAANGYHANATIHEVRIYNRLLTDAEMKSNQQFDRERYGS